MSTSVIWVHYEPYTRDCNKLNINNNHKMSKYQFKKLVRKWTRKGARRVRLDVLPTNPDYNSWANGNIEGILKQRLEYNK